MQYDPDLEYIKNIVKKYLIASINYLRLILFLIILANCINKEILIKLEYVFHDSLLAEKFSPRTPYDDQTFLADKYGIKFFVEDIVNVLEDNCIVILCTHNLNVDPYTYLVYSVNEIVCDETYDTYEDYEDYEDFKGEKNNLAFVMFDEYVINIESFIVSLSKRGKAFSEGDK